MIKHLDGAYFAAEVRFTRQIHKGAVLLLEGASDAKALGKFLDKNKCEIEICFCKKSVLDALDLLEDEGFPGVIAIVDADFDRITNTRHKLENLCLTDAHDLDLTIFMTAALQSYLDEHADPELIEKNFQNNLLSVRGLIMEKCTPLACGRLASERRNLRIYFKNLEHEAYVNQQNLAINVDRLAGDLIARSQTTCTVDAFLRFIDAETAQQHEPSQLLNGHDVAAVLGIAMREVIGTRRNVHTWGSELEAALRLAFNWEHFKSTSIYSWLKSWDDNNKPYQVLRDMAA